MLREFDHLTIPPELTSPPSLQSTYHFVNVVEILMDGIRRRFAHDEHMVTTIQRYNGTLQPTAKRHETGKHAGLCSA